MCSIFRAQLLHDLPADRQWLNRETRYLDHRAKALMKELARINQEIAQMVVSSDGEEALPGALAAAFRVVEDQTFCHRHDIKIAAIDMELGEIYVNPALSLSGAELHFVLAHEYLHAGLQHQKRCQGRDPYLWNIACDYVINAWLLEMGIGAMPDQGLLYDESLKELSAETIPQGRSLPFRAKEVFYFC